MGIENKEPGERDPEENSEIEETNSQIWERRLNEAKERSTKEQNKAAEIQSAKFQVTLLTIMERSDDNPELMTALNGFLESLDWRAHRGASDGPLMGPDKLTKFLEEQAKELHHT